MDNKEEIFKEIANFPGYYISNFGNVKSSKTNRLLKIQKSSRYSTVGLINNTKRYNYLVHRLVAQAFILNPENKPTVNHKNHDTYDNRIENLVPLCPTHHQYMHSRYAEEIKHIVDNYVNTFILRFA